jgi:hypothetical protein
MLQAQSPEFKPQSYPAKKFKKKKSSLNKDRNQVNGCQELWVGRGQTTERHETVYIRRVEGTFVKTHPTVHVKRENLAVYKLYVKHQTPKQKRKQVNNVGRL